MRRNTDGSLATRRHTDTEAALKTVRPRDPKKRWSNLEERSEVIARSIATLDGKKNPRLAVTVKVWYRKISHWPILSINTKRNASIVVILWFFIVFYVENCNIACQSWHREWKSSTNTSKKISAWKSFKIGKNNALYTYTHTWSQIGFSFYL